MNQQAKQQKLSTKSKVSSSKRLIKQTSSGKVNERKKKRTFKKDVNINTAEMKRFIREYLNHSMSIHLETCLKQTSDQYKLQKKQKIQIDLSPQDNLTYNGNTSPGDFSGEFCQNFKTVTPVLNCFMCRKRITPHLHLFLCGRDNLDTRVVKNGEKEKRQANLTLDHRAKIPFKMMTK